MGTGQCGRRKETARPGIEPRVSLIPEGRAKPLHYRALVGEGSPTPTDRGYEKHDVLLMTNFGATRVGGAIEEREIRLGTMVQVTKEKMAVELKECTDRHDGLAQGQLPIMEGLAPS